MGVPGFKKLQEYLEFYAKMRSQLYTMSKGELLALLTRLRQALRDVFIWKNITNNSRRKLKPQSRDLIFQVHKDLQALELELMSHLFDLETEENLHNDWESRMLPEPIVHGTFRPQYTVLSPVYSDDLSKLVDDSWFPVRISGRGA